MLQIYCDGACSGNPGPGGWAFVIPGFNIELSGYDPATTNNRMELVAVIQALNYISRNSSTSEVEIITDSQYVVNTMAQGWQMKKNIDLWRILLDLIKLFREVKWTWVKGHSSNLYNTRCDELAVAAYKTYQRFINTAEI
jgi:ribonuclease HI